MKREIPKVIIAKEASMNDSAKLIDLKMITWTINKLIDETDRLTQTTEALKKELQDIIEAYRKEVEKEVEE